MAKIVIVDDDDKFREMLAGFLKGLGHEVVSATDPVNLLMVIKEHRPNLIFMDMQMPAGGGVQAVRNLSSIPGMSKVPLLFCSGMPPHEIKKWFPENHSRRYVGKPVELPALKQLMEELLAS